MRVAYSIGRACGPAVARNRLRRRLREIVRAVDRSQPLPPGMLLIGARPAATELTFEQLHRQMAELLRAVADQPDSSIPTST